MQEWYEQGTKKFRFTCLFSFFLIFIPFVYAIEQCKGTVTLEELPCFILLAFNETDLNCDDYTASFYNGSTFLYTQTMGNYSPFNCNATFNYTNLGTYNWQYSTGDTGNLIVEEGFVRFYIYISLFIVLFILLIIGYYLEQPIIHILVGFLAPIMAWDIFINGFPNVANAFLTNSVAIILAGIGFFYLIVPSIKQIMEWEL